MLARGEYLYSRFSADHLATFELVVPERHDVSLEAPSSPQAESLICEEGVDGIGRSDQSGQARPDNDDVSVHGADAIG